MKTARKKPVMFDAVIVESHMDKLLTVMANATRTSLDALSQAEQLLAYLRDCHKAGIR
jgi:hypothetical protein